MGLRRFQIEVCKFGKAEKIGAIGVVDRREGAINKRIFLIFILPKMIKSRTLQNGGNIEN